MHLSPRSLRNHYLPTPADIFPQVDYLVAMLARCNLKCGYFVTSVNIVLISITSTKCFSQPNMSYLCRSVTSESKGVFCLLSIIVFCACVNGRVDGVPFPAGVL